MAAPDSWCPNCQQMVEAKAEPDYLVNIIIGGVLIGTYWFTSLVQPWYNAVVATGLSAVVAAAVAFKYAVFPRCPLCKTRNVQKQPPG